MARSNSPLKYDISGSHEEEALRGEGVSKEMFYSVITDQDEKVLQDSILKRASMLADKEGQSGSTIQETNFRFQEDQDEETKEEAAEVAVEECSDEDIEPAHEVRPQEADEEELIAEI